MAPYPRPGHPAHVNGAATTTLGEWPLQGQTMMFAFHNVGTEDIELFLTEKAKDRGAGHGLIVAGGMGWEGSVQINRFWTLAGSSVSFQAVMALIP